MTVFISKGGTKYLRDPQAVVIAHTQTDLDSIQPFLDDFNGFSDYLFDDYLDDATELIKFAGQLCYMSLGQGRTKNKDAQRYINHLLESGHGSVLEHASVSFLFFGISRSITHELVRHRAGFAYSQVSQRYVGPRTLRFVERPEFQEDKYLHEVFETRIDTFVQDYQDMILYLENSSPYKDIESSTERRKAVQQVARALLPNETEAPIVVTANLRAWRHFIEQRSAQGAETEIRRLANAVLNRLRGIAPMVFADYGTDKNWRKV